MSDDQLPSYADVLKEDQQAARPVAAPASQPSRPTGSRPTNPTKPARPPKHPSTQSRPTAAPARPVTNGLPWTYPANYHCPKCNNTGYKVKNGRSCKRCWRKFAPTNTVSAPQTFNTFPGMYQPAPVFRPPFVPSNQSVRPVYVRPGDPKLGGVLCGECRGSGRIRFFLDVDLCPLCSGVGRIIPPTSNTHVTF